MFQTEEQATRPLREVVYETLRDQILNGQVSDRERLTEPKLSKYFEVSRTPIREALSKLHGDGLIEKTDYGYAVVTPSLQELQELYELRVTLELRGISRVLENPTLQHDHRVLIAELRYWQELEKQSLVPDASFVLQDERFHIALSRASGNKQITEALNTVNQRIRAVRMYDFTEPGRIELTIKEHLNIVELLLAGDLAQALQALHEHVGESLEVVMERAAKAIARMAIAG